MSQGSDSRDDLLKWEAREGHVTPAQMDRWHKGRTYHRHPNKLQLNEEGLAAVATGFLPEAPIIGPDTRVLAVGSCFAAHFILWLAENGFNRTFKQSPYNALLRFGQHFESPAVIAQQFRWAFGELDPETLLWIDTNKDIIEATEEGRRTVRETLEQTDVLIITLGLSEVWYDNTSGEPLWRTVTESMYDPERFVFRVESVAQTLTWLDWIERLRSQYLPKMKIVFTVSPIPLNLTFRPVSAVAANAVSKAVLRAAVDEFLRKHEEKLNRDLFYYPSYEMVQAFFTDPFEEDNRHVTSMVSGSIVGFFTRYYCKPVIGGQGEALEDKGEEAAHERVLRHAASGGGGLLQRELLERISELEQDRTRLQGICDERQGIIEELDTAARQRLEVIERLDAEVKDLRQNRTQSGEGAA